MPRFLFETVDSKGTHVRGTVSAKTQSAALEQLLSGGQTPLSLKRASETTALDRIRALLRLTSFDYLSALRQLGLLLRAGLPVERALDVLQNLSASGRNAFRVRQLLDRVRSGEPLSQAFAANVPEAPNYVSRLIAAGEASGHLPEIVQRLAENLTRTKTLRDKLISDLTYPIVLVVAMSAVLWVIFTDVLPRLTPMFHQAGASLPLPTQILLAVGVFLNSFGWLILMGLTGAVALSFYTLRQPRYRLIADRIILVSKWTLDLPSHYESARFCRNLQTLLEGGLPVERALSAARDGSGNAWFRERVSDAQKSVAAGEGLRQAFSRLRFLPPLVAEFAAVGEETGRLGAMMGEAALILDHDVQTRLNRFSALVLPLATLVMGALVACIMAGIVSGMLAVNDLAGRT